MAKPKSIADGLTARERVILFCASGAYAANVAITRRRARASRDITVPIGTPVTVAISR